ncbi:MAG: C-GCAxxG-C-C family protein [Oceanidesulfovibrio sp.]
MTTTLPDDQTRIHRIQDAADHARCMARDKYLCAESVFGSLVRAMGWDIPNPTALATGFCSGVSRTRGQCGALSGAILALGCGLGRTSPAESLEPCYAAIEELVEDFCEQFGGRDCLAIAGHDISTPDGLAAFREEGKWAGLCEDVIAYAVTRSLELLDASNG